MSVRRLVKWRPVGAVDCPRCGEKKPSGGVQTIEYRGGHAHGTEKKLMCDSCRRTFVDWYEARADETGFVEIGGGQ